MLLWAAGRNLFFSTDVKKHIAEADVVFVRSAPLFFHCGGPGRGDLRLTAGRHVPLGHSGTAVSALQLERARSKAAVPRFR